MSPIDSKIAEVAEETGLHPEARLLLEMAGFAQSTGAKLGTPRALCKFCDGTGLRVIRGDYGTAVVSRLLCVPNPGPGTLIPDQSA